MVENKPQRIYLLRKSYRVGEELDWSYFATPYITTSLEVAMEKAESTYKEYDASIDILEVEKDKDIAILLPQTWLKDRNNRWIRHEVKEMRGEVKPCKVQ